MGSGVSTRPESTIRSSCSVEIRLKLSSASVKLTSALFLGVSNADPPGARRLVADSKIGASRGRLCGVARSWAGLPTNLLVLFVVLYSAMFWGISASGSDPKTSSGRGCWRARMKIGSTSATLRLGIEAFSLSALKSDRLDSVST